MTEKQKPTVTDRTLSRFLLAFVLGYFSGVAVMLPVVIEQLMVWFKFHNQIK